MNSTLIIIILLLAANAFFVAAEFALVKVKSYRIEAKARQGSRAARMTLRIHNKLEPYLAACQLGITMASLGLGWVGEPAVSALLEPILQTFNLSDQAIHTIAFLTGFIIFSSLHIVVGEQVPKTFAIRRPEPVSLWIAYPLHFVYVAIWPLNWLLNAASVGILRMFGVADASHHEILTDDEIKGLIVTSQEHGNIEDKKATMLQNLFEFDTRTVQEIMVPRGRVSAIDLQDPWEKQEAVLQNIQHSRFPVTDGGDQHLAGMLLVKDLYNLILSGETDIKSQLKSLVREALTVPDSQTIGRLFERMRASHQHMAVVIDGYGSFAGIITMEDLLEEIVGDIQDELDKEHQQPLLSEKEGYFESDGWAQFADLERAFNILFPEEVKSQTLSGLFMYQLDRIPKVGDEIEESGYRFTVKSMSGQRVDKVRIEQVHETKSEESKGDEAPQSAPE